MHIKIYTKHDRSSRLTQIHKKKIIKIYKKRDSNDIIAANIILFLIGFK